MGKRNKKQILAYPKRDGEDTVSFDYGKKEKAYGAEDTGI